jgi:hypothetical protein
MRSRRQLLSLAAVAVVAVVPSAGGAVHAGTAPRTTAPPVVTTVKVTITDSAIRMHPKIAQRGSMARFIVVNTGKKPHTFALGHTRSGTATQTGFTKALKPNQQSVHIFFLDFRGLLPYRSILPADRGKTAMQGSFRIV